MIHQWTLYGTLCRVDVPRPADWQKSGYSEITCEDCLAQLRRLSGQNQQLAHPSAQADNT